MFDDFIYVNNELTCMETTHIRISKELKQELLECDGQNFTERINNLDSDNKEQVNTDVNIQEDVREIKTKISEVNKKLTKIEPLTKREIDDVLSRYG